MKAKMAMEPAAIRGLSNEALPDPGAEMTAKQQLNDLWEVVEESLRGIPILSPLAPCPQPKP